MQWPSFSLSLLKAAATKPFLFSIRATALLSNFNTCISTPLFACAAHLARRKENLCAFLRRIVDDIVQEVKKQMLFPATRLFVSIIRLNEARASHVLVDQPDPPGFHMFQ